MFRETSKASSVTFEAQSLVMMGNIFSPFFGIIIWWLLTHDTVVAWTSQSKQEAFLTPPPSSLPASVASDRRSFLAAASTLACCTPVVAHAIGEGAERMVFQQKPTAPLGALLPAVQQRLLLEAALTYAERKDPTTDGTLKAILPPLDTDDNYYSSGRGRTKDTTNLKVLQHYNPARVLRGDVVRAAMNVYQTNLDYSALRSASTPAFTVTDATWKKEYIRTNDGLPDVQKVIGADVDMRQLLRNEVQRKVDDAAAELYAEDYENEELVRLLQAAAESFDLWLDRVRYGDVRDAIRAALGQDELPSVKIYESYAAGFLPP